MAFEFVEQSATFTGCMLLPWGSRLATCSFMLPLRGDLLFHKLPSMGTGRPVDQREFQAQQLPTVAAFADRGLPSHLQL